MELRLWDHAPQDHHRASNRRRRRHTYRCRNMPPVTCRRHHLLIHRAWSSLLSDPHVHRPSHDNRQGYRPAAPIQRFNNKTLNWPSWFRHFKAVAHVHGWDRDQHTLQLVSYLDEAAMNVAQELADDELYDYDTLVKLLSARFDLASRVSASRSRLHTLILSPNDAKWDTRKAHRSCVRN